MSTFEKALKMLAFLTPFCDLITEFKSQFTEELYKEVIAFANTDGGTVYVGVENSGNVIGLAVWRDPGATRCAPWVQMGASVGAWKKRRHKGSPAANLLAVSKKASGLLSFRNFQNRLTS